MACNLNRDKAYRVLVGTTEYLRGGTSGKAWSFADSTILSVSSAFCSGLGEPRFLVSLMFPR